LTSGRITELPYSARVFGLPKTHAIEHPNAAREQLDFLVWCLGFFLGMRMTITEARFIDATPIKPGVLHDVVWCGPDSRQKALGHAERFWGLHCSTPRFPKALTGAIHSFFLSQKPNAMAYERFIYLYVALEGCHFVHRSILGQNPRSGTHKERVACLCTAFGMPVPAWADPASTNVADYRNETLHEGLFFDEPLGFAGFGGTGPTQPSVSVILQMKALVSRLLFALMGVPATDDSPKRAAAPCAGVEAAGIEPASAQPGLSPEASGIPGAYDGSPTAAPSPSGVLLGVSAPQDRSLAALTERWPTLSADLRQAVLRVAGIDLEHQA
jgi:hypothetical protein